MAILDNPQDEGAISCFRPRWHVGRLSGLTLPLDRAARRITRSPRSSQALRCCGKILVKMAHLGESTKPSLDLRPGAAYRCEIAPCMRGARRQLSHSLQRRTWWSKDRTASAPSASAWRVVTLQRAAFHLTPSAAISPARRSDRDRARRSAEPCPLGRVPERRGRAKTRFVPAPRDSSANGSSQRIEPGAKRTH